MVLQQREESLSPLVLGRMHERQMADGNSVTRSKVMLMVNSSRPSEGLP